MREKNGVKSTVRFDEQGREIPDPTPVAVPVRFRGGPSLAEEIKAAVRQEVSRYAESQGFETFEEADDFDVEDDPMPASPHELAPDIEGLPRYNERRVREHIDRKWKEDYENDRGGVGDRRGSSADEKGARMGGHESERGSGNGRREDRGGGEEAGQGR